MPLETATYLSDLNPSFPNPTDLAAQGDDHIRLIKSALKNSFPNVAGPVSASDTELDDAADVALTGAKKLADSGAFFNTNTTDGLTNPAAGEVDVEAGGNAVVKFKSDKSAAFQGPMSSLGPITGPGAIPIGGTLLWWSDTLPDSSYGTFAWCNGATYLRSNTALFAILGTKYGVGDGLTTANLPDLRDNVPVGKGNMGGVSAAGRITNFVSSTLGSMWGECLHLLGINEMPAHSHTITDPGHTHVAQNMHIGVSSGNNTGTGTTADKIADVTTTSATTGISINDTGGGLSHNNVQPSLVCNYVIRTA